jgi:hypothetical protein
MSDYRTIGKPARLSNLTRHARVEPRIHRKEACAKQNAGCRVELGNDEWMGPVEKHSKIDERARAQGKES